MQIILKITRSTLYLHLPRLLSAKATICAAMPEVAYRIAGKFGEDFNLAVWRIVKNRLIKFSLVVIVTSYDSACS